MRILLTGGCGFIGSAVVRHLIRQTSHEVLNVDCMTYAASEETVGEVAADPRYHHAAVNIINGVELQKLFDEYRPDAVMHLAAESHVDRSIDGPGVFVETNVTGTYALLEPLAATGSRLMPMPRKHSVSIISQPMKCSAISNSMIRHSPRRRRMIRAARIRRRRRLRIIWCALGIIPMACPLS